MTNRPGASSDNCDCELFGRAALTGHCQSSHSADFFIKLVKRSAWSFCHSYPDPSSVKSQSPFMEFVGSVLPKKSLFALLLTYGVRISHPCLSWHFEWPGHTGCFLKINQHHRVSNKTQQCSRELDKSTLRFLLYVLLIFITAFPFLL